MKLKITIILSMLMLLGCFNLSGPSKFSFTSFEYPLEVGNSWTYENTITYSNIRPDTAQLNHPLVMKGSSKIKVEGSTFIGDFLEVMVLKTIAVDSINPELGDPGVFFFGNNKDGLYEYGHSGRGNMAVPISRPPTKDELTDYFSKNIKTITPIASASLDEAKQSIKYPITLNSEWLFTELSDLFTIRKRISGYKMLNTKLGNFQCFTVEWIYTDSDYNIKIIDYISRIGLMKRTITAIDVNYYTYDRGAENSVVTYNLTRVYNLVEFSQSQ